MLFAEREADNEEDGVRASEASVLRSGVDTVAMVARAFGSRRGIWAKNYVSVGVSIHFTPFAL